MTNQSVQVCHKILYHLHFETSYNSFFVSVDGSSKTSVCCFVSRSFNTGGFTPLCRALSTHPSPLSKLNTFRTTGLSTDLGSCSYMTCISTKLAVNSSTSPFLIPFHQPRLTPTFQRLSRLRRVENRKFPRPVLRSMNAHIPPRAPPRIHRLVGSTLRGMMFWNRQMLPQAVPIAPVVKKLVRRMTFARRLNAGMGVLMKACILKRLKAPNKMVK
jgi:hypothetical protein